MRQVILGMVLLLGACDRAEVDRLRTQSAAQRQEIDALKAQLAAAQATAQALSQAPAAPPKPTSDLPSRFAQFVKRDAVRMSRASGLKLDEIVDENGMVLDVEKIAKAVRDKTIRMYGKESAQRALVNYLGVEIGNAVFFGKLKNPE